MTSMSKTAAIAAARNHVHMPYGSGTSWTVTGPYRCTDPDGPVTEHRAHCYSYALRVRTEWAARVALFLMGRGEDQDEAEKIRMYDFGGGGNITDLVNDYLARNSR